MAPVTILTESTVTVLTERTVTVLTERTVTVLTERTVTVADNNGRSHWGQNVHMFSDHAHGREVAFPAAGHS